MSFRPHAIISPPRRNPASGAGRIVLLAGLAFYLSNAPAARLNDTGITTCSNETQSGLGNTTTSTPT